MGLFDFFTSNSTTRREEDISFKFLNYYHLLTELYQKSNIPETQFNEEMTLLLDSFDKTKEVFPSSWKFKGHYNFTQGNHQAAIIEFDKAISNNKNDWFSLFFKAKSIRAIQNNGNVKSRNQENNDVNGVPITKKSEELKLLRATQYKYLEEVIMNHKKAITILNEVYKNGAAKIIIEESEAQIKIAEYEKEKHDARYEYLISSTELFDKLNNYKNDE
jgi:tetratricopeptide (TPR) repeat protein